MSMHSLLFTFLIEEQTNSNPQILIALDLQVFFNKYSFKDIDLCFLALRLRLMASLSEKIDRDLIRPEHTLYVVSSGVVEVVFD